MIWKKKIFARLSAKTIETVLKSELSEELNDDPYEAKDGDNQNGHYSKKVRMSAVETNLQVTRDQKGEYGRKLWRNM